jgi:integrase
VRLARLTAGHVGRLQADLLDRGLSAQTVHNVRATLHRAMERAVAMERIGRNVVDLVPAPKVRREPVKGISPAEGRAILAAFAGHALEPFVAVVLLTGLRRSEALGLVWRDVDLDGRTMTIRHQLLRVPGKGLQLVEPKTAKRRGQVLPMAEEAAEALRRHRAAHGRLRPAAGDAWRDTGLIFTTATGGPLDGGGGVARVPGWSSGGRTAGHAHT